MWNELINFEDILKPVLAIVAGIVLGLEREMKDKKAGLKTISIICLGATLFTLISLKIGGDKNQLQLATAIVSGVGFIGAGAIFKDGLNVSGLTTAGIVWLAAAIGTALGFGLYGIALIFLLASLFLMLIIPFLFDKMTQERQNINIQIQYINTDINNHNQTLEILKQKSNQINTNHISYNENKMTCHYSIFVTNLSKEDLFTHLSQNNQTTFNSIQID